MKPKNLWLALAMTLLCGCIEVEDELTLNGDGSGDVRILVKSSAGMSQYMNTATDPDRMQYPPTDAKEANLFFPPSGFEVSTETGAGETGEQTLLIKAKFKDVAALLASPYARLRSLELKKDGDALVFRAISGLSGMAHYIEGAKNSKQAAMYSDATSEFGGAKAMKVNFKVNLPNVPTQSNGEREGKGVTWQADRNKTTNAADFLALVDRVFEARCGASGILFNPKSPSRLALNAFAELQPGAVGEAVKGPDAKEVEAAAKFVPCAMQIQRSIDLSGKGYGGDSEARLVGYVVLPAALKPQLWGAPVLEEAVDAAGKSLKPAEDEDGMRFSRYSRSSYSFNEGDDEEEDEDKPAETEAEERHLVSLEFQSPDWNVKSVGKVKGSITLNYGGGLHLAKVTNAIPASWIPEKKDSESPFSMHFSMDDEDGRVLKNADLEALGAKIKCASISRQMGGLQMQLQMESEVCVIKEVQVYDAEGKACPTMTMSGAMMGDDSGNQVYVGGEPKAPLSVAILVSGSGGSVKLPIVVENIPVRGH